MMKKIIFIVILICVVSVSAQLFEIEGKLEEQEKVKAIVILKAEEKRFSIFGKEKDVQDRVLDSLNLKEKKILGIFKVKPDFHLKQKYSALPAFAGEVTSSGLRKLRNNPYVEGIYLDKKIHIMLQESVPLISADKVWNKTIKGTSLTGKGQAVCVVDTGVDYTHENLGNCSTDDFINGMCGNIIGGWDYVNDDNDPMDDHSHGTHIAGTITSNNAQYKGVAPDANIVAVKVLDHTGEAYDSSILRGIDHCIRYAGLYNLSVISLSIGSECSAGFCYGSYCDESSAYTPFINKAVQNNIAVVAASGNNYDSSQISEPACVSNATPVGSVGDGSPGATADQISPFSNRWSLPMVFAPGAIIVSTKNGGGFRSKVGTSISTPHAAAVAALMQQYSNLKGRAITPQHIENILQETGKQLDGGYKRIDALAAIEYLETVQYNLSLKQGWNLLSSPLNLTNITEIFNPLQPYFVSMFAYKDKEFVQIYLFNLPDIDLRYGVWLKLSHDTTLTITGKEFENPNIPLAEGWNLVGYPYLEEKDAAELFENFSVYSYNGTWSSYASNRPFNSLINLNPGYGYWIKKI